MSRYKSRYEVEASKRYRRDGRKLNKKKVFLCVLVLVLIIFSIVKLTKKPAIVEKQIIDVASSENLIEEKYFLCLENNKWGIIDEAGNTIITPEYNEIIQIPNPEKDLFICYYDVNYDTKEYKTKVLNKEGQELFADFSQVEAIMNTSSGDNYWYEQDVLKFKKDGKFGLINFSGKIILDPSYQSIEALDSIKNRLVVEKDDKKGLVDTNGNTIIEAKYDDILGELTSNKTGYITIQNSENSKKYGYVSSNGNAVIPTEYEEISILSNLGQKDEIYLLVKKDSKYGVISEQNNEIIKVEYEEIDSSYKDNIFAVKKDGKWGIVKEGNELVTEIKYASVNINSRYIAVKENKKEQIINFEGSLMLEEQFDKTYETDNKYVIVENSSKYGVFDIETAKEIIPQKYKRIEYLTDNLFVAQKDSKSAIINEENKELTEYKYLTITTIQNSNLIEATDSKNTVIYNKQIEQKAVLSKDTVEYGSNYISGYEDEQLKYFDLDGNSILGKDAIKNNEIYLDKKDGKYGYINKNGEVVVEYIYEDALEFNQKGFAAVKKDGKWGAIDKQGNVVCELKYELKNKQDIDFIGSYYKKQTDLLKYYTK